MRDTSRVFTLAELAKYGGTNYDLPILTSFNGDGAYLILLPRGRFTLETEFHISFWAYILLSSV